MRLWITVLFLVSILLFSCTKNRLDVCAIPKIDEIPTGSTVVIGHAYGGSSTQSGFLAPKVSLFLEKYHENISEVIFTGDVFGTPSLSKWRMLKQKYNGKFDIYIAPGNHDVGFGNNPKREIFELSPFSLKREALPLKINGYDLILEDSNLNSWLIGKETQNLTNTYGLDADLVLLRHHVPIVELLEYANSREGAPIDLPTAHELSNFFSNIDSLTIISGDSGAFSNLPRLSCNKYGKITFITNGIGEVDGDSILILKEGETFLKVL